MTASGHVTLRPPCVEIGLPAARTPMPWTLRAAVRYLAELGGDLEMARIALDLVEPRRPTA